MMLASGALRHEHSYYHAHQHIKGCVPNAQLHLELFSQQGMSVSMASLALAGCIVLARLCRVMSDSCKISQCS